MYYIIADSKQKAVACDYIPEELYIIIDQLPPKPRDKKDCITQLYANLETEKVWWQHDPINSGQEPLPTDLDVRVQDVEGALDILLEGLA